MSGDKMNPVLLAGLLTGVTDGLFSSVLSVAFYNSAVQRLWQGVASVLLGPSALQGGTPTELIGIAIHFGVAFTWSILFRLALYMSWLRELLNSPMGALKVAALFGPLIWMAMSLVVIPLFTHRPPAITV